MQATKDSFYITLRDRLVAVDPGRTITLDGATRPAIVVVENEPPGSAVDLGSTIFWTPPAFSALVNAPPYLGREVSVSVFFYPEVNQT